MGGGANERNVLKRNENFWNESRFFFEMHRENTENALRISEKH